jgi:hypothetical protein
MSKRKSSGKSASVKVKVKTEKKQKTTNADQQMYWLMKAEPHNDLSFTQLKEMTADQTHTGQEQTDCWDGVRNYSARNNMQAMKEGM